MDDPRKLFLLFVFAVGLFFTLKTGGVLSGFPRMDKVASVDYWGTRARDPGNVTKVGLLGRIVASTVADDSGTDTGREDPEAGMDLPINNINVAVFTCQVHWLFKMGLLRRPLVYRCPHTRRTITFKSAYNTVNATRGADVVIFSFHVKDPSMWREVMATRTARQIWVYSTEDSAFLSPQVLDNWRPVGFGGFHFNMSFGYHSMFDVYAPYGSFIEFTGPQNRTESSFQLSKLRQKTRGVAWISSHCVTGFWNRSDFVGELSKFIPVDKYGACGNRTLDWGVAGKKKMKSYKFVLALENSCCTEYISEKFWRALAQYEVVPVVVGASRSEYQRIAPPNSFIHADDFDSLSELADYLRKVANDDELYSRFHQWRLKGRAELHRMVKVLPFTSSNSACALLKFLEERAWRPSSPLIMHFDPYGREWLGKSESCGNKAWLKAFDRITDPYGQGEKFNFQMSQVKRDQVEKHRRELAKRS